MVTYCAGGEFRHEWGKGGPVEVNGVRIREMGAAKIEGEAGLRFEAEKDAEILLVVVLLD